MTIFFTSIISKRKLLLLHLTVLYSSLLVFSFGKIGISAVTSTELGYLSGVTSNIQTQLDGKASEIYSTHYAGNTSTGFLLFMRLTFYSAVKYANGCISFKLMSRGDGSHEYELVFKNLTSGTELLFSHSFNINPVYTKSIYVIKSSDYVFDIYTNIDTYGNIDVRDVRLQNYFSGSVTISYPNTFSSSLPVSDIESVRCSFTTRHYDSLPSTGKVNGELIFVKS